MATQKKSVKNPINTEFGKKFNISILLWGHSGSGKTTFAGSYTKGPIHFYLSDPHGTAVLRRNANRDQITEDVFTDSVYKRGDTYPAFYKQLQQDEKSGFFNDMLKQEGLVVIDSYTTLENYLVDYVCQNVLNKKQTEAGTFTINRQDWPTISGYVLAFFKAVASLPCATIVICHSKTTQDEQNVMYFRPTILGQQADQAPRWFSEYARTEFEGKQFKLQVAGNSRMPSASKLLLPDQNIKRLINPTMDTLYKVFHGEEPDCKTQ